MIKKQWGVESNLALMIVLVTTILAFSAPGFWSWQNIFDLFNASAVNMIFAVGLVVVLIIGGIDISFSVGASVIQYISLYFAIQMGMTGPIMVSILALSTGLVLGCLNATFIYGFRIVSIIVTIATFNIFFGLLMFFTNGRSIWDIPDWLYNRHPILQIDTVFGNATLHLPIAMMIVMATITYYVLCCTGFGRQLYGYGSNPEAATREGVSGWKVHLFAYGWLGICAAVAGIMQVHIVREVVPNALYGREFDVLAAVVLGGATLGGGKGSVIGALLGVLFLSLLQNGMNLLGVSPYAFRVIVGVVILVAITGINWRQLQENLNIGGGRS
ncbi:ABC transporter permease [Suttonella ornithocola]|uniref:Ribose transport system permease protein rbsC n=1 Tax=Suttonella ornithocola TaxID=279832 RepID=A0A380MSP6_9GAMM|nr:ABC transporter permease [Suttonella ornithocola]SUO94367.1 Ribose transport system permease protein rbsC [Suttonella ornithocola]